MSDTTLSPVAFRALVYLVFSGKPLWIQRVEKKSRDQLQKAGLVRVEKHGKPARGHLVPTDRAWDFLADAFPTFGNPPPDNAKKGRALKYEEALDEVLSAMRRFMVAKDLALVDMLEPAEDRKEPELLERIEAAYLTLALGQWQARVHLHALRTALSDVPSATLEDALMQLQQAERLFFFPLDNPRDIQPEDEGAAFIVGGIPQYVVRMKEASL